MKELTNQVAFILNGNMTKEEGILAAAEKLHQLLWSAQQAKTPVLLLVSGGSALEILNHIEASVIDASLTLGVLDERFSQDPAINNFAQFMTTKLYADAAASGSSFIDTRLQWNEPIEKLAERFEATLKNWRAQNPSGKIFITQGMGADGHTAGIMPFPENPQLFGELFDQPEKWIAHYDAGNKNQFPLRVTTTLSFLKTVDASIFFVFGEDKKTAMDQVNSQSVTLATTPAGIVRQIRTIYVFTDLTTSFQT